MRGMHHPRTSPIFLKGQKNKGRRFTKGEFMYMLDRTLAICLIEEVRYQDKIMNFRIALPPMQDELILDFAGCSDTQRTRLDAIKANQF